MKAIKDQITKDGYKVSWSAGIRRWEKSGKDRLYFPVGAFLPISSPQEAFEAEWVNPYGLNTRRIVINGAIVGRRHEYRGDFVEILKL